MLICFAAAGDFSRLPGENYTNNQIINLLLLNNKATQRFFHLTSPDVFIHLLVIFIKKKTAWLKDHKT